LHGWLPLFGAVEVRIGSHRELIDGHEPLDAIIKRYETWWVDESLRLAKKLGAQPKPAPVHHQPIFRKQGLRPRQIAVLVSLVAVIAIAWGIRAAMTPTVEHYPQRNEVGEQCMKNADCWSECLPRIEGSTLGVCTQYCATDSECPSSMRCDDVYWVNPVVGTKTHGRRCVPLAW
jgi:hypothetical protein